MTIKVYYIYQHKLGTSSTQSKHKLNTKTTLILGILMTIDLKKLKRELPAKCYKIIAQNAEVSVSMVTKVLNGQRQNTRIIEEASKLAASEQERLSKIAKMQAN